MSFLDRNILRPRECVNTITSCLQSFWGKRRSLLDHSSSCNADLLSVRIEYPTTQRRFPVHVLLTAYLSFNDLNGDVVLQTRDFTNPEGFEFHRRVADGVLILQEHFRLAGREPHQVVLVEHVRRGL